MNPARASQCPLNQSRCNTHYKSRTTDCIDARIAILPAAVVVKVPADKQRTPGPGWTSTN